MANGEVLDQTGARIDSETPYREGSCIFYYREPESESKIPFEETIIYEDENILVADKPHFLPVTPAGRFLRETLLVRLRRQNRPDLTPIHRLDRETAGVVLFSLKPTTRGLYTRLFRERQVQKVYEALATTSSLEFPVTRRSRMERGEPFFRMREVDGESNAETHIEVADADAAIREGVRLYRLRPATGKKHQLRLHMAALGIPILNDRLYPGYSRSNDDDFSRPLKLISRSLAFVDPLTGREHFFESTRSL
jgi:tRNA pseudouridine32 synthase/23S rRNA pseudouridine746 synthase